MTMSLLEQTLHNLRALVSCDTTNPPREISAQSAIFDIIEEQLSGAGFSIERVDLGDGCVSFLATRGTPRVLMNCHLDTVPANSAWSRDPLDLLVEGDVAIGLGACDIKGAAAAMIAAATATSGDIALLFTSDEEAGSSRCVKDFCLRHAPRETGYELVLVAEPTRCEAVLEHRGILTQTGLFDGVPGHASQARALVDSALHEAARWCASALTLAQEHLESTSYAGLEGICFNLGRMEGGVKPNMIAASASVWWGMRPLPSQNPETLSKSFQQLAANPARVTWKPGFYGPTLPAPTEDGAPGSARVERARQVALAHGFDIGAPVDFWTEAALFSQAGYDTVVLGPGDIAQAHAADEWVELAQLERAATIYAAVMRG
ncbi:MAG: acetylornithine deacetylase [Myxococcota bacterium]|nr:acetylornithine deacetylase [Myxococcota bacterium]